MKLINNMKHPPRHRERRSHLSFILLLYILSITLCGCKEEDDLDNVTADTFNGTVTAKVENGASYEAQISTVWALYDAEVNSAGQLNGRPLGNCDYANGGFTVIMTEIPTSYLMNVQTFFSSVLNISSELEIDEPDARMLHAEFVGVTSENNYVDFFTYTKTGSKPTLCHFVYVNSDVTVTSKNVNVILRSGWNRIYWTSSDKKVTSKAPSGIKWYIKSHAK